MDLATCEAYLDKLHLAHLTKPLYLYLQTLEKWNKAYNLTAINDFQEMLTHHILDSLAILPFIRGKNILDVGTGAGLPGIPLALAKPESKIVLLDSNGKKTRFLQEVCRVLQISNVEIHKTRVEAYKPNKYFDTIVSRAFSNIIAFTSSTKHLLHDNSIWLAMKGQNPLQELKELKYSYKIEFYKVPELDAKRCCVIIDAASSFKE